MASVSDQSPAERQHTGLVASVEAVVALSPGGSVAAATTAGSAAADEVRLDVLLRLAVVAVRFLMVTRGNAIWAWR